MIGSARKLLLVTRFCILRLVRQPGSTIIMIGMPLLIIPVIGAITSKISSFTARLDGAPDTMAFFAVGLVVMFQLFGGRFSMDHARESLLSDKRWRITSAPCSPSIHAIGIIAASTLVSLVQGLLLVVYSRAALGVRWGSIGTVLLVLLGLALLSQLVFVALLLLVRSYGAAASLGWVFAYGSCVLGGLIVPMRADTAFGHFMTTYGSPYSLAQTALVTSAGGGPWTDVAPHVALLYGLCAVVALVVVLGGRRKLA